MDRMEVKMRGNGHKMYISMRKCRRKLIMISHAMFLLKCNAVCREAERQGACEQANVDVALADIAGVLSLA